MENTKISLKKDEEVEVDIDIDVLEEEIESGKILLTENKNVMNSRSDKAGVRGGGGGGEVKKIGGLSGCPVLSRCVFVCVLLDSQLLALHNLNYAIIIQ